MSFGSFTRQPSCARHVPHGTAEAVPDPFRPDNALEDAKGNDEVVGPKFGFTTDVIWESTTLFGRKP